MFENKSFYKENMKVEEQTLTNMDMCNKECVDVTSPVMECPKEVCEHRYIYHEVPHIMPMNTRIINHHVYKHTYIPEYTCCEENEYCNVYGPRC